MGAIHDQRLVSPAGQGRNWLQRIVWTVLAGLFVVAAFFFITVALVAGAFLAVGLAIRWWWVLRRIRARAQASQALEGEYRVVENTRGEMREVDRSHLER